jgi:hypothetical protein
MLEDDAEGGVDELLSALLRRHPRGIAPTGFGRRRSSGTLRPWHRVGLA